jgi:hypothetical protein
MALIADFQGLWTDPNFISKMPAGAASTALNVVSDRPGTAECVPGQELLPGEYATAGERLRSGTVYGGKNFEHTGSALYRRDLAAGTLTKVADNIPASGASGRMRFAVAGDDLYMATMDGVRAMDGASASPAEPGLRPMPDIGILTWESGTTLAAGASVAYRVVLLRNDADGRTVLSAPSGRGVLLNFSDTAVRPVLMFALSSSARIGDYVQVYKTPQALAGANPGDLMGLVYESPVTSAMFTGGVVFKDTVPDSFIGTPLYTNSTSVNGGVAMANLPPPASTDLALFRDHLFLSDVRYPHRLALRVIAVPSSSTIAIAGHVYSVPSFSSSGSVARDIETWARYLVNQITVDAVTGAGPALRAYYVSGESDPPGMIAIERETPAEAGFTAQHVDAVAFEPVITAPRASSQDVRPNGLSISKRGLPYAFPSNSAFHLRLGAASAKILRIIPNRDSLFVFKEDGIWVVYEAGGAWGYRQISTDVVLMFPDSVSVMDNQIHAFTNRGLVVVDESGIEEFDLPVKNVTQAIMDSVLSSSSGPSAASIFGVADPDRLRYSLWYATESTGQRATRALVYNAKTDTWTERDDETTGAYAGPGGLLYLGDPDAPCVTRQRNTGTASDYQGPAANPLNVEIQWWKIVDPSGQAQFTELRLLTEEPTSGPYEFTFTNHYGESDSVTAEGENLPEVRLWVPDGVQRTTRLKVNMKRQVLEEYLVVLGLADTAEDYNGPPTRG